MLLAICLLLLVCVKSAGAEVCDVFLRVGDATGRSLPNIFVSVNDRECYLADLGVVDTCVERTNDDGVAHFVMDRGIINPDARVIEGVRVDPHMLQQDAEVSIACGGENAVRLQNVFRSGRGRFVVRSPLKGAEGCGNILLVHGVRVTGPERCEYNGGEHTWCDAAQLLTDAGYGVAEFSYPTDGRVQPYATRLGTMLARVASLTGNKEWFVITHSFGGLVVRECMSGGDALCAERVRALVTLGAPHKGISRWCSMFACRSRAQIVQGSKYLVELASRPLLGVPTTAVAGTKRPLVSCTPTIGVSDGAIEQLSALPEAFAENYTTKTVPLSHDELSCMENDSHKSLQIAVEAFADADGCALPCVAKEDDCGKGFDACCADAIDNDCDGRVDFRDIDCFDDGNGEF